MASPPWTYFPQWLDAERARHLLRTGWENWPWEQGTVSLFGRLHLEPRRSFYQADEGCNYRYAGRTLRGMGWHPDLAGLRSDIEAELGTQFNSVLVNAYRNGHDYMGYHQDNEPELGPHPHVASLSLGASRDLVFRSKTPRKSALCWPCIRATCFGCSHLASRCLSMPCPSACV